MDKLCHLAIRLEDCHVPVEREFIVPSGIRLDRLHAVIQAVMGWSDSHLHAFCTANGRFTAHDPKSERSATLADVVNEGCPGFGYEYDFGDDWRHSIEVKSFNYSQEVPHPIHCLTAKGACPPEDVGGSGGYERFCEIINDSRHPEHKEMRDWVYGLCGYPKTRKWPDGTSTTAINKILHRINKGF